MGAKAKLQYGGGMVESKYDADDAFPIRLQVAHRHFTEAPGGTLLLYEDRIEFAEFGNSEHRFRVPVANVVKLDFSVLDEYRLTWTLHFSEETAVGDKATLVLDVAGRQRLILFVDRYCSNAEIRLQ